MARRFGLAVNRAGVAGAGSSSVLINVFEGALVALTAILDLQLKPDALETAEAVIRTTLTATRAFPGCLGVTVLVDVADPAHLAVQEIWESAEADQAYRAWRATPEGATDLGSILAAPPRLAKFTVADGV